MKEKDKKYRGAKGQEGGKLCIEKDIFLWGLFCLWF